MINIEKQFIERRGKCMKYLIGIDVGTSATKTVLFDELGTVIASASREYPLYQPQNGWAEQNPEDWRNAVLATVSEVVEKSAAEKEDILGIGISGQMHGLVMLDEKGEEQTFAYMKKYMVGKKQYPKIRKKDKKKRTLTDVSAGSGCGDQIGREV